MLFLLQVSSSSAKQSRDSSTSAMSSSGLSRKPKQLPLTESDLLKLDKITPEDFLRLDSITDSTYIWECNMILHFTDLTYFYLCIKQIERVSVTVVLVLYYTVTLAPYTVV